MDNTTPAEITHFDRWLASRKINRTQLADACDRSRQWLWSATRAAHIDKETRTVIIDGLVAMGLTATESDVFENGDQ